MDEISAIIAVFCAGVPTRVERIFALLTRNWRRGRVRIVFGGIRTSGASHLRAERSMSFPRSPSPRHPHSDGPNSVRNWPLQLCSRAEGVLSKRATPFGPAQRKAPHIDADSALLVRLVGAHGILKRFVRVSPASARFRGNGYYSSESRPQISWGESGVIGSTTPPTREDACGESR